MEVLLGNAIVAPQMPLRLVPEVLDSVDVIDIVSKQFGVVDPHVMELRDAQHVISSEAVCTDYGVGPYLVPDDRKKHAGPGIRDDDGMNLAASLQKPEDWRLACCAPSTPAFPAPAKVTLINLGLTAHQARF